MLAELLPRWLAVWLGIRKLSPRDGEPRPSRIVQLQRPGDTGGGYRPDERPQDPSIDPREPASGESSSSGESHGWANCTMASGAIALAYHTRGEREPWGGHLRHEQDDQSGGTDLYDLRQAWERYAGETLTIKTGAGWSAVAKAHDEKRAIVLQGTGEVPGAGDYAGAHAVCIGIDTNNAGSWLLYDPLVSAYQWVSASSLRSWAERFHSSIAFAVSRVVEEPDEPDEPDEPPKPPPAPDVPPSPVLVDWYAVGWDTGRDAGRTQLTDESFRLWLEWLQAPASSPVDVWDGMVWSGLEGGLERELEDCPDPLPGVAGVWSRGAPPDPSSAAIAALRSSSTSWDGSSWTGSLWSA